MRPEGFEEPLLRGHVAELAVAVVIGAASTAVVDRFAESWGPRWSTWWAAVVHSLVVLPTEALLERRTYGEEPGPPRGSP
ncbi:Large-conductance mechanosensitive channel, MscL [Geodermatophilus siccatus]|uniref:Large-conductance mechanosensitive channel, MscL n=1 Tax=Geodermatophilus siccatus TaxID=1137991 RepID=A0A1H0AF11_9ACTN|nr:MscL family protein [Geodermatophilus siccatus]SDN31376.1 Large-conductance mechanosensitive channel, MscL [Geodermatophilus siccatus]